MIYNSGYSAGYRYAVLDINGGVPKRTGKIVFHRLTESNRTACNGTLTFAGERLKSQPKGVRPCVRCYYNRHRPRILK